VLTVIVVWVDAEVEELSRFCISIKCIARPGWKKKITTDSATSSRF
jgi:predicted type IV restriction endonuclease